jgi:hypothetical protein
MLIQDGKTGKAAAVNSDNALMADAVVSSAMCEASLKGDAYSWTAVTTDINTGDTALCVVNQSKSRKLVIQSLYVYADVPSLLKVHVPAACTWAGTAVVGVNLNREKASVLADAVAYADETGTTFADANVILTIATNETATDQFGVWIENLNGGALILGYDDAIAVDIIGESAAFNCTIVGYYIDA